MAEELRDRRTGRLLRSTNSNGLEDQAAPFEPSIANEELRARVLKGNPETATPGTLTAQQKKALAGKVRGGK